MLDTLFIVMFASTNAQSILGAGRTEFPEDGTKGLALQERTGNYITVEKTYGNRFAVGQGISIGAGLWSQSLAADRRVTKIEDSSEVEMQCAYISMVTRWQLRQQACYGLHFSRQEQRSTWHHRTEESKENERNERDQILMD